jgi:hypothetical protein
MENFKYFHIFFRGFRPFTPPFSQRDGESSKPAQYDNGFFQKIYESRGTQHSWGFRGALFFKFRARRERSGAFSRRFRQSTMNLKSLTLLAGLIFPFWICSKSLGISGNEPKKHPSQIAVHPMAAGSSSLPTASRNHEIFAYRV